MFKPLLMPLLCTLFAAAFTLACDRGEDPEARVAEITSAGGLRVKIANAGELPQETVHAIAQHLEGLPIGRVIVTHAHPDHIATTRIAEDARFDAKLTKVEMPVPPGFTSIDPNPASTCRPNASRLQVMCSRGTSTVWSAQIPSVRISSD